MSRVRPIILPAVFAYLMPVNATLSPVYVDCYASFHFRYACFQHQWISRLPLMFHVTRTPAPRYARPIFPAPRHGVLVIECAPATPHAPRASLIFSLAHYRLPLCSIRLAIMGDEERR